MNTSETIPGNYDLIIMKDGTQILMSKHKDGKWRTVDDRLKEQKEFEDRFLNTSTVPSNWEPATEIQALVKSKKISTKEHLLAHLIEVLGSPTDIIQNGLDKNKMIALNKNTAERDTLLVIIRSINDPQWNEVSRLLRQQASL